MAIFNAEQSAQLQAIQQKWLAVAQSTLPMDRVACERGIKEAYRLVTKDPSPRILWFSSPIQAILTVAYLNARRWRHLWRYHRVNLPGITWNAFEKQFYENFGATVPDVFWDEIGSKGYLSLSGPKQHTEQERLIWSELLQYFRALEVTFDRGFRTPVLNAIWPDNLGAGALERLLRTRSTDEFSSAVSDYEAEGGQHDIFMLACHEAWRNIFGFSNPGELTEALGIIASSAGWWWAYDHLAIVCDRPRQILFDDQSRLHSGTGPAVIYPDGWNVYCWHGVRVPANVILAPDTITVSEIESQRNLETRRILMERYGIEHYLTDCHAEELHRDKYGVLYRRTLDTREQLVMVKVINATPEQDGSRREYFIRVPPHMKTAQEAVAWTFGLRAKDYHPHVES